jgi:dUTP pyrophosphatase
MPYILYLQPSSESARAVYTTAAAAYNARPYEERDAGFDLFSAAVTTAASGSRIQQQVVAGFYDVARGIFRAYWMLPRSSISRSPLRLANSVGLIDAGYRGPIMAAVDGVYNVADNERLFQLASPDLLPWDEVRVVETIPGGPTARGAGGFGSTGTGTDLSSTITTALVATAEEVAALDMSGARISSVGFNSGW